MKVIGHNYTLSSSFDFNDAIWRNILIIIIVWTASFSTKYRKKNPKFEFSVNYELNTTNVSEGENIHNYHNESWKGWVTLHHDTKCHCLIPPYKIIDKKWLIDKGEK